MEREQFLLLVLVALGGSLIGCQVAVTGPIIVFEAARENCSLYTSAMSCEATHSCFYFYDNSSNISSSSSSLCLFSANTGLAQQCGFLNNESACSSASTSCQWKSNVCQHSAGWTATQIGWFSALLCAGGMAATPLATPLTNCFGADRVKILLFISVLSLATAVASHFSFMGSGSSSNSRPMLLIFVVRTLVGSATSLNCITTNLVVGEKLAPELRRRGGSLFQGATTVCIFIVSGAGLLLGRTIDYDQLSGQQVAMRLQVLFGINTLVALLATIVSFLLIILEQQGSQKNGNEDETSRLVQQQQPDLTNNDKNINEGHDKPEEEAAAGREGGEGELVEEVPSDGAFPPCRELIAVIFTPIAQQASGINSLISTGVLVSASAGVPPLVGSLAISSWNMVTSVAAVGILGRAHRRISFRRTFLCGVAGCAAADLIVTAGFLLGNERSRGIVVFLGAFVFIAAFELALAPVYYPLATRNVMSKVWRDRSVAATLFIEGIVSFATNFGFPVFIGAFSDGLQGQAIAFFAYGVVSTVCFVVLAKSWNNQPALDYG